ncbi:MAG: cytochrome c [Sphingomonas sp.]|nr:cytochrome c [Sphingomonas sp.]
MRWIRWTIIPATVLGVAVLGGGWAASESIIRQHPQAPYPAIIADRSPAGITEGSRLGKIVFCQGCHGNNGEGDVLEDVPGAKAGAPALAYIAATHSDGEIARAIRYGVGKDGHQMYVMPVQLLGKLADQDIAAIIGWMRSLRASAADLHDSGVRWTPVARYRLLTGELDGKARTSVDAPQMRPADHGRYFVTTSCQQCHGLHQARQLGSQVAPPLAAVAAAYDPAAFRHLLRTGRGMTPRDLGWMAYASTGHLKYLTDGEITQIQTALKREEAAHPTL